MLKIRPIMDSAAEDVLAFKTCCSLKVWDQNLEIHLTNTGEKETEVYSYFDLIGKNGAKRVENLMPNGKQRIKPGQTIAFYCYMDDREWGEAQKLVFYTTDNQKHVVELGCED
ncbi:MAG: hypothetical protein DRH15_10320 [Deltaproteobacteria bacterium]|nr:MAG: hypothetical protein DRH15_10320 [Deltaproteobacteria bacterium]